MNNEITYCPHCEKKTKIIETKDKKLICLNCKRVVKANKNFKDLMDRKEQK